MKKPTSSEVKYGVWCAIGGAIITMIIGFSWGGWVTGSTAQKSAEEMATNAVNEALIPICVAQFNQDPQKLEKLVELKSQSRHYWDDIVEKAGWAIMPGSSSSNIRICGPCAYQIMELNK